MIALPAYIDRDAWEGFEEMRNLIKKPMTDRARKLIVYELQRIKDGGHCANAALDQSTLNGWKDVYPAKDKPIAAKASGEAERTRQMLDSRQEPSMSEESKARLQAARNVLKRVA